MVEAAARALAARAVVARATPRVRLIASSRYIFLLPRTHVRGASRGRRGPCSTCDEPLVMPRAERGFCRVAYVQMGAFQHACEGDMLIKSTNEKVPYFNAPIYLENKSDVGKVDEILGTIQEVYFSVKPADGISAASFKPGDKLYINPEKLLPCLLYTSPSPRDS